MPSKVLTLLLSLAAQSGVYARPTGPRAIAEISTALVLLNAPSRAWAFVEYSPGSENVCGELCEWDAIAYATSRGLCLIVKITATVHTPTGNVEAVSYTSAGTIFSQFAVIMTGSSAYAVTRIWDGRGESQDCYDGADVVQSLP